MKKVAFVVEGQTEQVFVSEFIGQLVRVQPCHIALKKYQSQDILTVTKRGVPEEDATHIIWIINVQGDDTTISFIEENISAFKSKGFGNIYGLRDHYSGNKQPINPEAVDKRTNLLTSQHGVAIEVTVAIEEIEAWFLSVPSFFQKYDPSLTEAKVQEILGVDPTTAQVESIPHPAAAIDRVLTTVGLRYRKRLGDSYKISKELDYMTLYLDRTQKLQSLGRFVGHLTSALP